MSPQEPIDLSNIEFVDEPPPRSHPRKSKYAPLYALFEDLWDKGEFDKWVKIEVQDRKQAENLRTRLMDYATKYRKPVETAVREEDGQVGFYFRPKRR